MFGREILAELGGASAGGLFVVLAEKSGRVISPSVNVGELLLLSGCGAPSPGRSGTANVGNAEPEPESVGSVC